MNPYQYVVLRCVPRVEREEFVNVAVVLYCQAEAFLVARWRVDPARLRALDPELDLAALTETLELVDLICMADGRAGAAADGSPGVRFGLLTAPRSTVVQPGPVHGGLTDGPAQTLDELADRLI